MSFYSSLAAPDSGTLPSQTAEIIRTIEQLRRTNPIAAAIKATQHITHVPPKLAADLLRRLMRTDRPYSSVAETLAARVVIQGGMKRGVRLSLARQAETKGLSRTAAILKNRTDN